MAYSVILFLSHFLLLLPINLANISFNSSLFPATTNSSWLSPSEDFAFGFFQLTNTNLYLLAIWFEKIPDKTVVWQANGNHPVQEGSRAEFTADGIVLTDQNGNEIWSQRSPHVAYAAMLDNGNFVLADYNAVYLWESFKNPTDTLLPNQSLNSGHMLFSRLSETNYSRGRFVLNFSNGDLQLNPVAWPSYTESLYNSYFNVTTSNASSPQQGTQLVFNASMNIYIVTKNGGIVRPLWDEDIAPNPNYYYRATLDFNGVFTQYYYPQSSITSTQTWITVRYVPDNICTAVNDDRWSGACGYNSYCSLKDGRPRCDCPPGYSPEDPNDLLRGCQLNFPQGCGVDDGSRDPADLFTIMELNGTNWPNGEYEWIDTKNQTDCQTSCLYDCACSVAVFSKTGCWKKRLPLTNGILNGSYSGTALIKVRKSVPLSVTIRGIKNRKLILLGSILLGGSVFFILLLMVTICLLVLRHKAKMEMAKMEMAPQDSYISERNLHSFTYKELEEATDMFKEELGRGSCGIVYKGVLKFGSRNLVAVKKLDKLAQEGKMEFRTEVRAIGKTHHRNLVRLLGYCDEGPHQLLVYEFMGNGTLANFIFGVQRPDWKQRTGIALGIAGGLVYLHEQCDGPIIHCDIKPQNILLDEDYTARISDFGLAKLLLSDQTRTRTGIRGTRGYVAPEWFKNVPVTVKVDVYSFGVMLLEIICCRKCVVKEFGEEDQAILTDWAYDCYIEDRLDELLENDEVAMGDMSKLQRWVMIAIWCIQEDPSKRPTMKMVAQMLEGVVEVAAPPSPCSFSSSG